MGDEGFDRLYAEQAQPLFRFLVYRTGDRALAEDLLADTFERVLRSRRFNPGKATEKTWLYTIALNRLRDHARRIAAEKRALSRAAPPDDSPDTRSSLSAIESRDDLSRALDSLSPEEREVVALRFGADLTMPEIAKLTTESLTTVEGRVYRGLRKLRKELT
jgi:RNA polymerase sigma factor (sigma-70 family)